MERMLKRPFLQSCGIKNKTKRKKTLKDRLRTTAIQAFLQMELFDPKQSKPVHKGRGTGKALGVGGFIKPLKFDFLEIRGSVETQTYQVFTRASKPANKSSRRNVLLICS